MQLSAKHLVETKRRHSACTTPCLRANARIEAGMLRGCPVVTALTVQEFEMEAHRTRQCRHTGVTIARVIELSGREVGATQMGPPLHVLGAQGRSVRSLDRFDLQQPIN
jgi:hypothetical protein